MCRGLAVLMDKRGKFFSEGISSHSNSLGTLKEDDCLKFEVIVDDSKKQGYSVEVDEQYEKHSEQGKEAKSLLSECKKWIKDNELQVLRWLLNNQSYKKSKRDIFNYYQKSKRDIFNSSQKSKRDIFNSSQKSEGEIFIEFTKNYDKEIDDFIYKLSREESDKGKRLTWKQLVKLAIKGYGVK